jgi:eukaryotic-like serine/threonine-protein kinase
MPLDMKRVQAVFLATVEENDLAGRAALLDRECGVDKALRQRVEALLRAHDQPDSAVDQPVNSSASPVAGTLTEPDDESAAGDAGEPTDATRDHTPSPDETTRPAPRPITEGPDTRIGPYRLREKIGEGGMGVVYLAEQVKPVRRRVALKIIKPGMDTEQVVARFEAERQALALMDHPSIARVFDAGATDTGRPYFVMELVKGVPITDYCDTVHLTPKQRLELFIPVCQAIQHAHQKGIIHRDVKPSNVLVTMQDGKPVPKVIDFGIAKAVEQRLTERSLYTQHGTIMGTLEYMSPEQAEMSAMDVDTRTDVYALGVLLYELLTGSTPLERSRLRQAGYEEILRRIREEEPPKPSTRLSESRERLPSVAAQRRTEPARLTKLVRGELDWIVMKAIEKDRTRRYETANGFARDIERYLEGDPVEAGPPSASYRLRKFARKHRAALVTAGSFALLLATAAVVSAYLAVRATSAEGLANRRLADVQQANAATTKALTETTEAKKAADAALAQSEEARTQAEAVSKYLVESFRKPDPSLDGKELKVVDLLDQAVAKLDAEFAGSPKIKGELLNALGQTYQGLGLPEKSVEVHTIARAVREAALGPYHPDTLGSHSNLATSYQHAGRTSEAIAMHEETLKLAILKLGPDHPNTLIGRNNLAGAYLAAGRTSEAIAMHEETLKLSASSLGPYHPDTLVSRVNLANTYLAAGRTNDAIAMHEETLKLAILKLGPDHPHTLANRSSLAESYRAAGRTSEAIALHEETLKLMTSNLGPYHPDTLVSRNNLATSYAAAGRTSEAIALHEETLKLMTSKLGPDHPDTLTSRGNLAASFWRVGRLDRSVPLFEETLKLAISKLGPDHPDTLIAQANLGINYRDGGRPAEGARLMQEALERAKDHPDALAKLAWVPPQLAEAYAAAGQFARAEPFYRAQLDQARKQFGPNDLRTAAAMASVGRSLLMQQKWADAEPVLRECLAVREKLQPDEWSTFNARSLLGGSLLGQKKYALAELLVLSGYQGMKAREAKIPAPGKPRLAEAGERVVNLYEAWGQTEKAREWRKKLRLKPPELPSNVFAR